MLGASRQDHAPRALSVRGLDRRHFVFSAATACAWPVSSTAAAAPPLSETNFGLTYAKAARSNAWLEIDAEAFASNVMHYRRVVGTTRRTCVVVKGDAYGNGLAILMPTILSAGIEFLGVASNDEARIIRTSGFKGRIMRLRLPTLSEVEDGFEFNIEELVGSVRAGQLFAAMAIRRGGRLRVHLALNSAGMSREGIAVEDARGQDEALALAALPGLVIVGIMAHFPVNDLKDILPIVPRFRSQAEWLVSAAKLNRRDVEFHCANSFAALNIPDSRFDLIRSGRAFFGYGGEPFPQFRYLATLKSRVASVNRYRKGATVSYERTFELQRDSVLANIPLGASDGFRPAFSGGNRSSNGAIGAHVMVRGFRAPVVGRVTMNTIMVDVTDVQDKIEIDDEIIVFGPDQPPGSSQADFLRLAGTNPPDLMTVFGNSLPKVLKASQAR
jgi:alanine racemase